MANKLGPSSILSSLLFLSLIIGTTLSAPNLNDNVLEWVKKDHRRFLRAVIYVSDLDRSVRFYTKGFGMKLLKRRNFPDRQYRDALVGFGPQNTHFLLELRHRHDSNDVFIGTEFGHFGIATPDVYKSVEKARANGALVIHKPQKLNQTVVAFVQDRDGYKFKLIQRTSLTDPLVEIMLHVQDLNRCLNFYTKALGMKLFERQNNSTGQIVSGTLGYGTNQRKTTVLQLEKRKNIPRDDGRDGYSMVYIGTDNVNKSADVAKLVMKELGGNIVIEPVLLSNINVKLTGFSDPDNWMTMDASGSRARAAKHIWADEEDRILVECLVQCMQSGHWQADKTFRLGFLANILRMMQHRILGCSIHMSPHLESRVRTLKRQYSANAENVGSRL